MVPPLARRAAAVLLAASALTLGSCTQASAPTAAEYVAAADGVCRSTDEKLEELQQELDVAAWEAAATGESNLNVERPERWVRSKVIPEYRAMHSSLMGMPAPDGDAAYLSDLYRDLDLRIKDLNQRPSRGRDLIRADEELQQRFASYGMSVCGTV